MPQHYTQIIQNMPWTRVKFYWSNLNGCQPDNSDQVTTITERNSHLWNYSWKVCKCIKQTCKTWNYYMQKIRSELNYLIIYSTEEKTWKDYNQMQETPWYISEFCNSKLGDIGVLKKCCCRVRYSGTWCCAIGRAVTQFQRNMVSSYARLSSESSPIGRLGPELEGTINPLGCQQTPAQQHSVTSLQTGIHNSKLNNPKCFPRFFGFKAFCVRLKVCNSFQLSVVLDQ